MDNTESSGAVLKLDLICRTCLNESNKMKSIFIDDGGFIVKMLLTCSGLDIDKLDGFPTNICSVCLDKLYIAYEFHQQCKISHNALVNFMGIDLNRKFDEDRFETEANDRLNNFDLKIENVQEELPFLEPEISILNVFDKNVEMQDYIDYNSWNMNDIENGNEEKYVVSSGSDIFIINFKKDDNIVDEYDGNNFTDKIINCHTKKYSCSQCDKQFDKLKSLQHHRKTHLNFKTFTCELCNQSFYHMAHKSRHMKQHLKRFKCDECNATFTRSDNLRTHRKNKHESKKQPKAEICKICQKSFPSQEALNYHMIFHQEWFCSYCDQKFDSKDNLNNHLTQAHIGKKAFKCEHCNRRFASLELKISHMRQHSKVRPYTCDECGRGFTRRDNLRRHRENRHGVHKSL